MNKVAVLVPCYNEAQTIAKVIADAMAALPEAAIYVYNNNSTMIQQQLLKGRERLFVMSICRAKVM